MVVIALCIALVAVGVVMVARWGGDPSRAPTVPLLRYLGIALGAGLAAGVLAAGAGGRLVMRRSRVARFGRLSSVSAACSIT